ncbi:MAG: flavodoxin domain-containing protein [Deltaproteobacteria bacterium]|nr:flavodoxin domain-containing protein [Candidatus Zymogenaceae bacterium]
MNKKYNAVKITDTVSWVGAIDWQIRDFHGYSTNRGTTYNAYLIMADKITLVDTVKKPFVEELISRISSIVDPKKIDYIISNHSEMDHSGSLVEMMGLINPERVYVSKMGKKNLEAHFHEDVAGKLTEVKDGEKINLGNMNVTFLESRMLHWPDSMISYLKEEKLVFSQDAFGMHLASTERFADELDESLLKSEAAKYYANILLLYSPVVAKFLDRVTTLNLDIDIVAPDHGPIWRTKKDIEKIVGLYAGWAEQKPTNKALVVYDTMWKSTEKMARAISEGLGDGGSDVKVLSLGANHRSDVATEILNAGALVVGSPTMNNQIFPTLADTLTYLKGLKPKNLIGAAFGSYGWSGESVKDLSRILEEMGVELVGEGIGTLFVPDEEALGRCYDLGRAVAERLSQYTK